MEHVGYKAELSLRGEAFRIDISNFHLAHYRRLDGFLITGKNSGSHWLKCMMSHALARQYHLPPPRRTSGQDAEDFIGHPRRAPKYRWLPQIGSSHNLPSTLLITPLARRMLRLPPTVVLVRAIPEAMLSHWVKWGRAKRLSLTEYVRIPAPGRRDLADVWWFLEFFNRWGRAAAESPDHVLIVRYEDIIQQPGFWLQRIALHFGVSLSTEAVAAGIAASSREFLKARLDPAYGETIVPDEDQRVSASFNSADGAYLRNLLAERLKFGFGYGLARSECPMVAGMWSADDARAA